MKLIRKLTLRNLKLNQLRTIVTIIGIMLSVALITVVAGIASSGRQTMINAMIQLYGDSDIMLYGCRDAAQAEKVENNRNVQAVYEYKHLRLASFETSNSKYRKFISVTGLSKNSFDDKAFGCKLREGRFPENPNEMILSKSFVEFSDQKYSVGDTITLSIGQRYAVGETAKTFGDSALDPYMGYLGEDFEKFVPETTKTYTITGILENTCSGLEMDSFSARVDIYTIYDIKTDTNISEKSSPVLYVKLTDNGESHYLAAASELTGIEETLLKKNNDVGLSTAESEMLHQQLEDNGYRDYRINTKLLKLKGISLDDDTLQAIYGIAVVVIAIIMISSIFIIRNSFAISITEKTKLYGMLSSVGATSAQVRNSVLYEGFILGLVGIPLGLLLGSGVTFLLIIISGNLIGEYLNGAEIVFQISWLAIAAAVLLSALTIFVSAFATAVKASRISPIEAIRSNNDIKITGKNKEKSYKTPAFIKKLFGAGGSIAWKNLKRSRQKYRTTVISIVVSVAVYITIFSFVNDAAAFTYGMLNSRYNLTVGGYDSSEDYNHKIENKRADFEKIMALKDVDYGFYQMACHTYCYKINSSDLAENMRDYEYTDIYEDAGNSNEKTIQATILAVDNHTFHEIAKASGFNGETIKNKGLIINTNTAFLGEYGNDNYQSIEGAFLKEPKGYVINAQLQDYWFETNEEEEDSSEQEETMKILEEHRYLSLELAGAANKEFIHQNYHNPDIYLLDVNGYIIVSMDWFQKNIYGEFLGSTNLSLHSVNANRTEESIMDEYSDSYYINNKEAIVRAYQSMILVVEIFIYGLIAVIALIGLTNIFNTITTNMNLRRKELAMLRSVGMTKKEFNRMIRLESIFYTTKSLLIGLPSGILGGMIINKLINKNTYLSLPYHFPWFAVILSIVVVLAVVWVIMDFSIRKVRRQNIIETIRNENI